MKKRRTWRAWAVVDNRGNLMARDYRLPLTWYRKHAVEDRNDYTNGQGKIIPVLITEVKK